MLIVEDEPGIARMVEEWLSAHGYEVSSASDGEKGARMAVEDSVGLLILDIMLPGLDGWEVLGRVRSSRPTLPVLMLTARDELQYKVEALGAGADDYLTKPFALEELLARVGALARRAEPQQTRLEVGDLALDLLSRRAQRGDSRVELSAREWALLEFLMRRPGDTISREQILSGVWEYDFDPGSNTIDVYIRYLRNKLDRPGEPSIISTVRGVGYRLNSPDSSS
ncbi:MAG: response regulator transcription factor [Rubrobacter sp.]|nr:response regulator transcription factor [Rubrobacter sp.]